MIRSTLVAATLALCIGTAAPAHAMTDLSLGTFIQSCDSHEQVQMTVCVAYAQGVIAVARGLNERGAPIPDAMRACVPPDASFGTVFLAVKKHTDRMVTIYGDMAREKPASVAIVAALSVVYPCGGK